MSSSMRRTNATLVDALLTEPQSFDFTPAVRILEHVSSTPLLASDSSPAKRNENNPVALYFDPTTEFVKFSTNQSFKFCSSEIESLSLKEAKKSVDKSPFNKQWNVAVNFFGLTGPKGVMPYHYTESIIQRIKMKDHSMAHFFDIFNHRAISLFYRAECKKNLSLSYELNRKRNRRNAKDVYTQAFLSLIGLGTKHLNRRLYTSDESLISYAGVLTQKIRTASGLKSILENHFEVPIQINEFVAQWEEMIDDVRSRFSSRSNPRGQNNQLGRSLMLGSKGWSAQSKIEVLVGPLSKQKADQFRPGTKALKSLQEMIRFYLGLEIEYSLAVLVERDENSSKVQLSKATPPIMGWNTWLSGAENTQVKQSKIVKIRISNNI